MRASAESKYIKSKKKYDKDQAAIEEIKRMMKDSDLDISSSFEKPNDDTLKLLNDVQYYQATLALHKNIKETLENDF